MTIEASSSDPQPTGPGAAQPAKDSIEAASGTPSQPAASSAQESTGRRDLLPLPGLAAIALYLVLLAGTLILGVAGHHYPPLFLILAAGLFTACGGLLMLFRWGWAMALAAVFLLACYNAWIFSVSRQPAALVQGLLNLVFVLYLIRTEVREKLR
jgi:hypothetical protein